MHILARTTVRALVALTAIGGLALGTTACGSSVSIGTDENGDIKPSVSINTPDAVESALDATNPPSVDKDKVSSTTVLPLYDKVGGDTQVNTDSPKGGDTIEPLCQQTVNGNTWYGLQLDKRNYKASLGGIVHFNIEGQGIGYTPDDKLHFPQADWAAKVGIKLPGCEHFSMSGPGDQQ